MGRLTAGLLAGAAGTTALNAVTYGDMVLRGRGPSSTPEQTADKATDLVGVESLGSGDAGQNRTSGLGAMLGIGTGVLSGALYSVLSRGRGGRAVSVVALTALATAGSVLPMTVLGVTNPRRWSSSDWVSDLVPHLAYGVVTAAVLRRLNGRAG